MKAEAKREALRGVYPGQKWQDKVTEMSPAQVNAIYLRLKAQGKV